ncbi:MAG: TspO/MBR family protein [Candidatus Omnitrophica bacterium ADurb.Bin292]|jgi:tryptophan-rich sensory protein|nr:MAG: TspO/MBR family protein [Candidatus Omnitrophica bacterium ADurb.Bin292]HPW76860.1 tryptophan-rich sensory protein [Candidatus Omnitrophota bacterium]HQB11861.1 tryptophan-rich sensory protein [Candidatus Omnitrophota bacterium]
MKTLSILKLGGSVLFCMSAGAVSSLYTLKAIPDWYATLNKPSFTPPSWTFGPVWSVLYVMMGIAAWQVWSKGLKERAVRKALVFFLIQLVLNTAWSFLFFGLRSPILGLVDILLLWLAVLITINLFFKVSLIAAVLLIPYLFWGTFASGLNLGIVLLNP